MTGAMSRHSGRYTAYYCTRKPEGPLRAAVPIQGAFLL